MIEFAKAVQVHVGAAALILFFGFLADSLSSERLKADVVRWIGQTDRIRLNKANVSAVLTAFLDGFLYKIFSARLFSWAFFLRSTIVFFVFLFLAVAFQALVYDDFSDQFSASDHLLVLLSLVLSVVIFNIVIDYISNVFSLSLLRMAAASGRVLDVVVVFFADLALTVTLFTLLFPVGMTVGVLVAERFRPNAELFFSMSEKHRFGFSTSVSKAQPGLAIKGVTIEVPAREGKPARWMIVAVLSNSDDDDVNLQRYIEAMRPHLRALDVVGAKDEKLSVQARYRPISPTFLAVKNLYYGSFIQGNVTRDQFLGVVALHTNTIDVYEILRIAGRYEGRSDKPWTIEAKCDDGVTRIFTDTISPPCKVEFGLLSVDGGASFLSERGIVVSADHFPISPFFFTSFALSLLFYFSLLIVGVGVITLRTVSAIFSGQYIEPSKPFSVLSLVAFALIEAILGLVALFT